MLFETNVQALKWMLFLWMLVVVHSVNAQYIPHHTDHEDVYNFLSELRVLGIVDYNPAVLPLSRKEIAELVWHADSSKSLNQVQRKELDFWKQEFGKEIGKGRVHRTGKFFSRREYDDLGFKKRLDLFYFANDIFQVTVNPVIGGTGYVSSDGELAWMQYWGAELFSRLGKGFGVYFNIRDYFEDPNWHGIPNISPRLGGVYRNSDATVKGIEYYEIRGGITYEWKWGQVGILKDHLTLGSAVNDQVVLSGRAPSFPRFHLQLKPIKWVELTYTFGWLNSELVDSTRSYTTGNGVYREVYHSKFLAANMVTVRPWKYLTFSLGSSVVIADNNFNIGHFIPVMFYTALDHNFNGQNNNAGQNSQVYADLNFDLFGWGRLFGSVMIDEIRLSTMFDGDQQRNSLAYQVGFDTKVFTAWNLKLSGSYTRVRPGVYRHYIPTTTYAHANYGLGHFLGANSDQWKVGLQLRPLAKLRVQMEYERWRKGPEVVFSNNPASLTGAEFMTRSLSTSNRYRLRIRYQIIHDLSVQLAAEHVQGRSDGTYTFTRQANTRVSDYWFSLGLNIGY